MTKEDDYQIFILKESRGVFLTSFGSDKVVHCSLDLFENKPKVGDIYVARVLRTDKARAWLDLGENKPALCFPRSSFVEGECQVVCVLKESTTTSYAQKGALVTDKVPGKEKYLKETDKLPQCIVAADPSWKKYLRNQKERSPIVVNDIELYHEMSDLGQAAVTLKSDLGWPYEIESIWKSFLESIVPIPGGGWILFEEGETLTAVDINTSGYDQKGVNLKGDSDLYEFNRRAGVICIEQIKLRNYGGRIVIDFPAFKNKNFYFKLWSELKDLFQEKETFVPGFTRTGLFELTRYRPGLSTPQKLKKINFMS
ncbi:hypothetical protein IM40_01795 [Candidatus Paracaedimonas acanthamoebae]|nr:hypothetical protein IM40_01795 [Candidatus Paracaedimonas acanthamoebae]